jgi:TPR repeat protein
MGRLLQEGRRVEADGAAAARHYDRACAAGIQVACADLGTLLLHGAGVPSDRSRALELFRAACQAGEPEGCRRLEDAERTRAP